MPTQITLNQLGIGTRHLEIDPDFYGDYLWQRLFSKSLSVDSRADVLSTKFYGTSMSYQQMVGSVAAHLPFAKFDTKNWDVFLAQTPFAGKLSSNTQLVVRYHDAIPITHPHTIHSRKIHQRIHYKALEENSKHALFVCNSEATKRVLLSVFPKLEQRTQVIPCCVPDIFFDDKEIDLKTIILNRFNLESLPGLTRYRDIDLFKDKLSSSISPEYFIAVGTLEPRKNYGTIIAAWERYRSRSGKDVKLVLVAALGWGNKKELERLRPHLMSGNAFILKNVPLFELRKLYSNAIACVAASYAEGFSYSGIESMKCGTPVIASDIDCHRDVYKEAALYFNPFVPNELTERLREIAEMPDRERDDLNKLGDKVADIYSEKNTADNWANLLKEM